MRHYTDLYIWQNTYSSKQLKKYFELFRQYCEIYETGDKDMLFELKAKLKLKSMVIKKIFGAAGKSKLLNYQPNNYTDREDYIEISTIEDIEDIVKLNKADITYNNLLEVMSLFESNKNKSVINTINPFHWIKTVFYFINEAILDPFYQLFKTNDSVKNGIAWTTIKLILSIFEIFIIFVLAYSYVPDFASVVNSLKDSVKDIVN